LLRRCERTADEKNLDEGTEVFRSAVRLTPAEHANLTLPLSGLGQMLHLRFERNGDIAALREAIDVLRRALAAARQGPAYQEMMPLGNLGAALISLYNVTGDA
jgi:hypothetical protein